MTDRHPSPHAPSRTIFRHVDPEFLAELEELTRRGFVRLEEEQLV